MSTHVGTPGEHTIIRDQVFDGQVVLDGPTTFIGCTFLPEEQS